MMDPRRPPIASYVIQKLGDMVECPICTGILCKPKMLQPCMHSFCLCCLELYAKGKQPGEQVPCPVCRVHVTVATGGFKSLPTNHIMENIVELHRISQPERRHSLCDNCTRGSAGSLSDSGNGGFKVEAYCVECRQKLCVRCVEAHKRLRIASSHQLVKLGTEQSNPKSDEMARKQFCGCSQHPNKAASHFCDTCLRPLCQGCVAGQHRGHEVEDISGRAKKLRKEIRMDVSAIKKAVVEFQRRVENVTHDKESFLAEVRQVEEKIQRREEAVLSAVSRQKERLLREVENVRLDRMRDMESFQQELEMTVCMLDSIRAFSTEVGRRGDADVIRWAEEIRAEAQELFCVKQRPWELVNMQLTDAASSGDAKDNAGGLLGQVVLVPRKKDSFGNYLSTPELVTSVSGTESVSGVTVLDYKLYIIRFGSQDLLIYHTEPVLRAYRRLALPCLEPQDLVSCPRNRSLYVCDWNTSHVDRLHVKGTVRNHWKVKDKPGGLSVTEKGNLLVSCPNSRQIFEFTPEGTSVRTIQLPKDLDKPWHAVQIPTSTRVAVSSWHRIGVVEETGSLLQVHGSTSGSQASQVACPSHLALDGNDVIIVADTNNNRVKLLGPSMECRELNVDQTVLKGPRRLHFDRMTRLLYIGLHDGSILVYRILT